MKNVIKTTLAALFVYTSTVQAVETQVEFGHYLNCAVYNDSPAPIRIIETDYYINGHFGPASTSLSCTSGCIVHPGQTIKMSGPKNKPSITNASCDVLFNRL